MMPAEVPVRLVHWGAVCVTARVDVLVSAPALVYQNKTAAWITVSAPYRRRNRAHIHLAPQHIRPP